MSDEELEALLGAIGGVLDRYRAGEPPRDEFEAELYDELKMIDGMIELTSAGFDFTVPDYVPEEWSGPDSQGQ